MNLYDCHEHDTFEAYRTGLRQLFEAVRYGKDKEQLKRVMEKDEEAYRNIDNDTRELLEVVAKIRIPEECKVMKDGEERFDMCKAFEDYRLEGRLEGKLEGKSEGKLEERREHLVLTVCKKLQKNKPIDVIVDELEEDLAEVEKVIKAQKEVGNYDVRLICKVLANQE